MKHLSYPVTCGIFQEKRWKTFLKQKKEITDLMLLMERSPETTFEKDVEDESQFVLSDYNMNSLNILREEVSLCCTH